MPNSNTDQAAVNDIPVQQIIAAVQAVQHGDVHIVIQDGKVIQINKTEKVRLR